jgi:hypothetical protein
MKAAVFRFVAPYILVYTGRRFRATCCLIALTIDAASISETSLNFYQTARRNKPEDGHLK